MSKCWIHPVCPNVGFTLYVQMLDSPCMSRCWIHPVCPDVGFILYVQMLDSPCISKCWIYSVQMLDSPCMSKTFFKSQQCFCLFKLFIFVCSFKAKMTGAVVNQALSSLLDGWLKITLTIPLNVYYIPEFRSIFLFYFTSSI